MPDRIKIALSSVLLGCLISAGCESGSKPPTSSSEPGVAIAPSAEAKAKATPPPGKKGGGAPILPGR